MTHLRYFVAVVVCAVIASVHASEAKTAKHARTIACLTANAEYVPAKWFRDFDQIEAEARISIKDRDRGAVLMMRALAGVSEPAEYAEAHTMLITIAGRYRKAAARIGQLAMSEETEDMRRGYVSYYVGMAKLCEDCAVLRTIDAAKGWYRPLTSEEADLLQRRKQLLDQLFWTCRYMEMRLRLLHGVPDLKN